MGSLPWHLPSPRAPLEWSQTPKDQIPDLSKPSVLWVAHLMYFVINGRLTDTMVGCDGIGIALPSVLLLLKLFWRMGSWFPYWLSERFSISSIQEVLTERATDRQKYKQSQWIILSYSLPQFLILLLSEIALISSEERDVVIGCWDWRDG